MIYDYKNGIYGIDSLYAGLESRAMVYIVVDAGRAAIIDTANNNAIKPTFEAMEMLGLSAGDIDYICLTHVHLDHAGGAGLFMESFPNARLVLQKRGVRHMVNPEKLLAAVRAVYGDRVTEKLYGNLLPIPEERIIAPGDGDEITFGNRSLSCLETPGHAKHHMIFHDHLTDSVFTGDAYGISYKELGDGYARGVIITTSPTQFDPEAMHSSIKKIGALNPQKLYLTHFGELDNTEKVAEALHRQVDAHVSLAEDCEGDYVKIHDGLRDILREESLIQDWPCKGDAVNKLFKVETELSAQGLVVWYSDKNNL